MKILIQTLFIITFFNSAGFAELNKDLQIEAELTLSDSEAAKIGASEAKRVEREEKKRQANLNAESKKAIKEAARLKSAAVKEEIYAQKQISIAQEKCKEYEKTIKINKDLQIQEQRKIQQAKDKVATAHQVRDEFKKEKESTEKEIDLLNRESESHENFVREANTAAKAAREEALAAKRRLIEAREKLKVTKREALVRYQSAKNNETKYRDQAKKLDEATREVKQK